MSPAAAMDAQKNLLEWFVEAQGLTDFVLWFYTPMAVPFARKLEPCAVLYECMDELSLFRGAPPELVHLERQLLERADVVTTGGHALYRAKRDLHPNVHPLPSSVDKAHFARARVRQIEPADQAGVPHIRLGFYGVIDERMDFDLIARVAGLRPNWHLIFLGPIAKIDETSLPRAANLHYLGAKRYEELPSYLAGWDVAILPFARNESTRFISPTKTPEYLAAGRPVVSTSIEDIVEPYGRLSLVHIADTATEFVGAIERALSEDPGSRLASADAFLTDKSWDGTFDEIVRHVSNAIDARAEAASLPIAWKPKLVGASGRKRASGRVVAR